MESKICVALRVKSSDSQNNRGIIDRAVSAEPDFIELRWDYLEKEENLTQELAETLLSFIPPHIQVINTFRSPQEGGHMKIEEGARVEILKRLIHSGAVYFDLEFSMGSMALKELITLASAQKTTIILSHHNFENTPSFEEAKDLFHTFLQKLVTLTTLSTDKSGPFLYKLIFTANSFEDNLVPLKLCKFFTKMGENRAIISFCMGELSGFSRVLCVNAGAYLTYASIEKTTAPGQLNIKKIREIQKILFS